MVRRAGNTLQIGALKNSHAHSRAWADVDEFNAHFLEFKPDVCVHLAARSSVRESLQNPGLYAESNDALSIAVLEAARRSNCRRVIHASSVMIYGKDAPLPYSETHIGTTPASFYGASKLAAETLMNAWRALHGMETIYLRLSPVLGVKSAVQDCARTRSCI